MVDVLVWLLVSAAGLAELALLAAVAFVVVGLALAQLLPAISGRWS